MTMVTNLEYYMDNGLQKMIEFLAKRQKKKWDNVLIIDGMERAGKTTLAKTIGYYYAYIRDKKFSVDNVFFDVEEMMNFAAKTRDEVIIWDEAALAGLSSQWQNKIQQKLITTLMMSGKYGHFYIFVIPSFFRLNRYLACDRSIGLINVYSQDLISRGNFICYSRTQKTYIYNSYKKSETYGKYRSLFGRFVLKGTDKIWDEKIYEDKKDEAIKKHIESKVDKTLIKLNKLQYSLATKLELHQAMEVGSVSDTTIREWRKLSSEMAFEAHTGHNTNDIQNKVLPPIKVPLK